MADISNNSCEENLKDWERLWKWQELDESEFISLRDSVWKDFCCSKIEDIREILHLSGLFFELMDRKLFDESKQNVLNAANLRICEIYFSNYDEFNRTLYESSINIGNESLGKTYYSRDSKEFQELVAYLAKSSSKYIKSFEK